MGNPSPSPAAGSPWRLWAEFQQDGAGASLGMEVAAARRAASIPAPFITLLITIKPLSTPQGRGEKGIKRHFWPPPVNSMDSLRILILSHISHWAICSVCASERMETLLQQQKKLERNCIFSKNNKMLWVLHNVFTLFLLNDSKLADGSQSHWK